MGRTSKRLRSLTIMAPGRYGRTMHWLGLRAVAPALLALATGCSLVLDFDQSLIDGAPPPVDAGPDAAPAPDGGPDPSEPNNDSTTATVVTPGSLTPLSIFPASDVDFFRFNVAAPDPHMVTIDANFIPTDGDLDLYLYDSTLLEIDHSENLMTDESITQTLAPGDYFIKVQGFGGTNTNTYELVLTII